MSTEKPAINPWFIAVTVTLATFMELLDTSIANVALPNIGGGLGRSYAGLILLHGKLGLPDFDADAVFGLLQSHLTLPIFEFAADLYRLSGAVA